MILWIWIHTSIEKKCSMIYWILLPKAEEGFIELNQCQVNNSWLKATYYIYPCIFLLNNWPHVDFIKTVRALFFGSFFFSFGGRGVENEQNEIIWTRKCSFKLIQWPKFVHHYWPHCPISSLKTVHSISKLGTIQKLIEITLFVWCSENCIPPRQNDKDSLIISDESHQ